MDGIRAIAVILVIIAHWFPVKWVTDVGFGAIGVEIFFVLSGFLISRILLTYRFSYESIPGLKRWAMIRNFMIRRALRIIPIYYLLLVVLILIRNFFPNPVYSDFGWYFFYLQNILVFKLQAWPGGKLSHLWTLAVEEQFYLIWPLILMFTPIRFLRHVLVICLCFGAISYILLDDILGNKILTDVLTISCIQGFASGGLLAYFHLKGGDYFAKVSKWFMLIGLLVLSLFILSVLNVIPLMFGLRFYIDAIALGLISFLLIDLNGSLKQIIFGNSLLVCIGKISYGIYLFHNFIPVLWNAFLKVVSKYGVSFPFVEYRPSLATQNWVFYLQCLVVLIILTSCSYYFFERPVMKWKERLMR